MKLFHERLGAVERQGIIMTSASLGAVPPDSESERIGKCSLNLIGNMGGDVVTKNKTAPGVRSLGCWFQRYPHLAL